MLQRRPVVRALLLAGGLSAGAEAQSFNIDVGEPGNGPPASYAAAGRAGVWNSTRAEHGVSSSGLVDLAGHPIAVNLLQIGGLDLFTVEDAATSGADAQLLDDFLITFDADLESCIFFDNMQPGTYEVLVYARMPDPEILSFTDVDQEAGNPHSRVGGTWLGDHELLISYSRHVAVVTAEGSLDLHSGIVPGGVAADGAALNGLQVLKLDVFTDGFESGDTSAWDSSSLANPLRLCCR